MPGSLDPKRQPQATELLYLSDGAWATAIIGPFAAIFRGKGGWLPCGAALHRSPKDRFHPFHKTGFKTGPPILKLLQSPHVLIGSKLGHFAAAGGLSVEQTCWFPTGWAPEFEPQSLP